MSAFACLLILSIATLGDDTDLKAVQGQWRLTALEADGMRLDVLEGEEAKVVFKGDRIIVGGQEKYVFKLDSAFDPKTIDLIPQEGEDKGEVLEGIYRRRGTVLTFCLRGAAGVRMRPVEFSAAENSDSVLVTLEKVGAE